MKMDLYYLTVNMSMEKKLIYKEKNYLNDLLTKLVFKLNNYL